MNVVYCRYEYAAVLHKYLCIHFRLHLRFNLFSILSHFGLERKPFVLVVTAALVFLIDTFHLLNCKKSKKTFESMLKAMCEEYKGSLSDINSPYRETLHKLPCWLSECQNHGTGHEYNDALVVIEG